MKSLTALFEQLKQMLGKPDRLHPAQVDPIVYAVYSPAEALGLRRQLPGLVASLRNDGWHVQTISVADLVWGIVEESGRYGEWLAAESAAEPDQINEAVSDALRANNALVGRVAELVAEDQKGRVVLLTDVELLHPFFRARAIESALHDRVKVPLVVFYPGDRSGQCLRFLGFCREDGNYRSPIIGG